MKLAWAAARDRCCDVIGGLWLLVSRYQITLPGCGARCRLLLPENVTSVANQNQTFQVQNREILRVCGPGR